MVQWFHSASTLLLFPTLLFWGVVLQHFPTELLKAGDSGIFLRRSFFHFQTWLQLVRDLLPAALEWVRKGQIACETALLILRHRGASFQGKFQLATAARVWVPKSIRAYKWVGNKIKIVVQCYLNLAKIMHFCIL